MAGTYNFVVDTPRFQYPQINLSRSTAQRMWIVNICAFAAVIQSSLGDSYSSLLVALSAIVAALATETLILRGRGLTIKDGSAVASALILTLLLPNGIFPAYAAAGAVFAMAVVKHSFGGLGSNWLNPAAGGWLFVRFSWPAPFNAALDGSLLSAITESGSGADLLLASLASTDSAMGQAPSFINNVLLSITGAELPGGYFTLFVSRFPGIIADRGVFALLIGTIVLCAFRVSRSWVPAVYLAVFGILIHAAGALPNGGGFGNGDVFMALFSGGTLVAAFFLAADPVTGAKSNRGMLLAAAAGGALAFVFRCYGSEPFGAVYAAVFVNAMLPLLRIIENRRLYEKGNHEHRQG